MLRRIKLGGVSITTAAPHVRILCMCYCNGLIVYILLHYLMKFLLEITKDKEMATFLARLHEVHRAIVVTSVVRVYVYVYVCVRVTLSVKVF